jgi:hypothetical protein
VSPNAKQCRQGTRSTQGRKSGFPLVNGQFLVPIGGQVKVPIRRCWFLTVIDLGTSSVSSLSHAVAVAVGDDDVAVVEEPVEHGYGGGVFGQESSPGFEGPVGAQTYGSSFVGGSDESE